MDLNSTSESSEDEDAYVDSSIAQDTGQSAVPPKKRKMGNESSSSRVALSPEHCSITCSTSKGLGETSVSAAGGSRSAQQSQRPSSAMAKLLKDLQESVECPVCFRIPRRPPVPCCKNGHVICQTCKTKCKTCPTCRVPMADCVSQIAATIIQKVPHPCEFRDEGCGFKGDMDNIDFHEENCSFRLVRCPHWACDESVTVRNLTHHVIASSCGDNYKDKPLPYKEEIEYTKALDDEEGNGFWRPSLLHFDGITFYLQVEKLGKTRNWYFFIQMEGSPVDCCKYGTVIRVSKNLDCDRNSVVYDGPVCPVDVKGAAEVNATGAGLNIRDAAMEKIFDGNYEASEGESDSTDQRFKFWVVVDIYKVEAKA